MIDSTPPAAQTQTRRASPYLKWVTTGLLIPALIGIGVYRALAPELALQSLPADLADFSKQAAPELPIPALPSAERSHSALVNTVEFVVRRNDTMERIFRQLKLSVNDLAAIRELPDVKRALDILRPGDPITFTHADGALQGLTRQVSDTAMLSVTREGDSFKAELITTPLAIKTAAVHGTVENSLYASARKAGLGADLIMRMANEIFGWDIDFALDIQPGDEFTVIYEKQYRDNEYVSDGRILAAEFINAGHVYRAIRYDSPDGEVGNYFTPQGRSMHKQFLRAPVDFTRISSGFSLARLHPILNTIRAHKGVDYAAPSGTPIKAAGDGKVTVAGVQNGYGNVVILDHGAGITTLYGHMSRFASGIRNGTRVKQGQVVGFVGSTGAATGPHLHYEYRINGAYKDPRTVPLPAAGPIPPAYMEDFLRKANPMLTGLDRAVQADISVASVAAPKGR